MKNPKSILITGASSGIGHALAIEYAGHDIILFLSGRNEERLRAVKKECEQKDATVYIKTIDVLDEDEMTQWITECDAVASLDMVITNAGISSGSGNLAKQVFNINVHGVFNTVTPSLDLMKNHGRGQIAIMSSIAGFRGLPSSPAYSTSKVAVKAYGEALRGRYHHQNIEINVICPGFVKSRLTASNKFKMPFLMESDKAAKIIRRGLEKNKAVIVFPWQMKFIVGTLMAIIPEFLVERLLRQLPKK